jgi:hypothetical protein
LGHQGRLVGWWHGVWCGGCCGTGILAWFLDWGVLVVACLVECGGGWLFLCWLL